MRKTGTLLLLFLFAVTFCVLPATSADQAAVSGVVRDASGAAVPDAEIVLLNAGQAIVGSKKTDGQGRFEFSGVPTGNYVLRVASPGFAEQRLPLSLRSTGINHLDVRLELQPVRQYVTVSAHAGLVEDVDEVAQQVNVIPEETVGLRAKAVVAQVAQEETGVALQRTSPTMAGVFVRGLTGDKVNIFIDGFRYSNSAARGGVNTFLDLIEPSTLQAVEILRGPSSAQYGSEAMGGSVQFLSRTPMFSNNGRQIHTQYGTFFDSADASFGSLLSTTYSTRTFGLLVNLGARRHNRLRVGRELDSHAAVTRFLGLPSSVLDDGRLPDTAFTQYGGLVRMNWASTSESHFIVHYSRSQQDGGRRYDQLLGGDGNLIADLRNLKGDFFYLRYEKTKWGWFDTFSAGYSFNAQGEERVNQGGSGNPNASINHEYERTNVHGFNSYLAKQSGPRQNFLFGGDIYKEGLDSPSFGFNPVSGAVTLRRPRVPSNARYLSGGLYAQDVFDVIPKKLRLIGNVRYSGSDYRVRASDSPFVNGARLWPDDSLTTNSVTFRAGVVATPWQGFSISGKVGRGFRAPSMTDLGTLGLTGSGFEVSAPDLAGLGGTVGSTADAAAVSTGLAVKQLRPETNLTYEVGGHYRNQRVDVDFTFFINDISDLIAKQSLILPPGAVGTSLGGQPITAQNANGVVFVTVSTNPVLARANFGEARIRGFEHRLNWTVSSDWSLGTVFTYLHAHDKANGLAPNIEGGTPAPDGYLRIRYAPAKRHFWIEPYMHAAGRQDRLSSLDLGDRRTGATRSRSNIQSFFHNGATARGLIGAGADLTFGTADDILLATGETLTQVQNRVLGVGVNSAPLFNAVPGYIVFSVRGGFNVAERHSVLLDVENIGDRNYRGISWGVDAPGRSVSFRYNLRF